MKLESTKETSYSEELRYGKPIYKTDVKLPRGWKYCVNNDKTYYKDAEGKFMKNRRNVLQAMAAKGGFKESEVRYIRDGLVSEGWRYHEQLPINWMYKMYTHKIEGLDTNVLYTLSPDGTIYRSKKMLMKKGESGELGVDRNDLQLLLNFKPDGYQETKTVSDPDESWIYDPDCVPEGWKMRKYCFNNLKSSRVEEVFHYLTPDNTVLRGKKHVYNYMLDTETFNQEDFNKFHFSKKEPPVRSARQPAGEGGVKRKRNASGVEDQRKEEGDDAKQWAPWTDAPDMPAGWFVRYSTSGGNVQAQYISPDQKLFNTRTKAARYVKDQGQEMRETKVNNRLIESQLSGARRTTWDPWIPAEDIPLLPGWQFSIGHRRGQRRMRYMDPDGGVFVGRGALIRHLHANRLRKKEQLEMLKKLLKVNQTKHFEELRKNDKFIKHIEVDENYLTFLKHRYENHHEVGEEDEPSLPKMWKKKKINGVDYFRDPSGKHIFNSRRLVVEFLRKTRYSLKEKDLAGILEESSEESDLSDTDDESEREDFKDEDGDLEYREKKH